jgi:osmotically-inducible protein OsmY
MAALAPAVPSASHPKRPEPQSVPRLSGTGLYAPGTPVVGSDGPVGSLVGVRRDPHTGAVAHLLVRQSRLFGLFGVTRLVPASWVEDAAPGRVALEADGAAVAARPPARPDAAVRAEVLEAFDRVDLPRSFRIGVRVAVRDGVVELSGHVRTATDARLFAERAGMVPGVLAVRDRLADDEALISQVAQALTADPDARRAVLRVDSRHGEVSLVGELPSEEAWQTAGALAAAVPGVRAVRNHVTVRPASARGAG